MSKVCGFYLENRDRTLELPVDSEVLGVGNGSEGRVILWVKDSQSISFENRRFVTFKNDEQIPAVLEPMRYVGTVSFGKLPFHVFELVQAPKDKTR